MKPIPKKQIEKELQGGATQTTVQEWFSCEILQDSIFFFFVIFDLLFDL